MHLFLNHLAIAVDQILIVPSSLPEANICESAGFQLTELTVPKCPCNFHIGFERRKFQIVTVLSSDPEAQNESSGPPNVLVII